MMAAVTTGMHDIEQGTRRNAGPLIDISEIGYGIYGIDEQKRPAAMQPSSLTVVS